MRTTLNLDDDLMRAAKRKAIDRGLTLTAIIELALTRELEAPAAIEFKLRIPTAEGRAIPGVDIADRDSLYDVMDGDAGRAT